MTYKDLLLILEQIREERPEKLEQRVHVISAGEPEFHAQLSLGLWDNALSFIPDYSGEQDGDGMDAA